MKIKKMMFLRSRANFQTTIFLVLFDMESCLMAHFEGRKEIFIWQSIHKLVVFTIQ